MPGMQVAEYEHQEAAMTLRQGLEEYHRLYPGLVRGPAVSNEAAAFFLQHDAVHVVYGCSVSLADELVVKISSIFGTTAGLGVLRGYALPQAREIYPTLEAPQMLATALRASYLVPRSAWRCMRQAAKWPWGACERYYEEPLTAIRERFGIRVAHAHGR